MSNETELSDAEAYDLWLSVWDGMFTTTLCKDGSEVVRKIAAAIVKRDAVDAHLTIASIEPTTPAEPAPTVEQPCLRCGGRGTDPEVQPKCCGRCESECGGRGCTGPEPEQAACRDCGGTGIYQHSTKDAPQNPVIDSPSEKIK